MGQQEGRRDADGQTQVARLLGGRPSRAFTVPLPRGAEMDEVVLSPDGKRLAWKLHARENGAGSGLLARLLAYFGARPRAMISLWVSRLDGSDFHEIGHEEAPPMHVWPEAIREAQWTPDGRHVSFLFQDALWTVPAE